MTVSEEHFSSNENSPERDLNVRRITGRDIVHAFAGVVAVLVPSLMIVLSIIAAVVYPGTSLIGPAAITIYGALSLAAVLTFYFTMRREPGPDEYEIVLTRD